MDTISSPIKIIRGKEIQLVIIFDGDFKNLVNIKNNPEMLARYMRDPDLKFADKKQFPQKKMQYSIGLFKYYQNKEEFNDNAKEIAEAKAKAVEERKKNPDYKAEEIPKLVPDLKFYDRLRNMRPYIFNPTLNKTITQESTQLQPIQGLTPAQLEFNQKLTRIAENK